MQSNVDAPAATEALRVAPSPIHRLGVFARRNFDAGDVIECCPVVVCPPEDEALLERTSLRGLYFHWEADGIGLALGFGSLYNHAWNSNARYEPDYGAELLRYVAVRPIVEGEEVTINYTGDPDGVAPLWFDTVEPPPASSRRPGRDGDGRRRRRRS